MPYKEAILEPEEVIEQLESDLAYALRYAEELEEKLQESKADLAAAQERLEEMREVLEEADAFIINRKPTKGGAAVVAHIRKVLRSAPRCRAGARSTKG